MICCREGLVARCAARLVGRSPRCASPARLRCRRRRGSAKGIRAATIACACPQSAHSTCSAVNMPPADLRKRRHLASRASRGRSTCAVWRRQPAPGTRDWPDRSRRRSARWLRDRRRNSGGRASAKSVTSVGREYRAWTDSPAHVAPGSECGSAGDRERCNPITASPVRRVSCASTSGLDPSGPARQCPGARQTAATGRWERAPGAQPRCPRPLR